MFPRVPFLIDTVLLPFKDRIIYDGQCQYYNIVFGGGMTRRLNESYQLAKAQSGVITTLPYAVPQAAPSEEEQLRFYLRTARNREMYAEEIVVLRQHSRALETLYQQEMGKVHARTYGPRLRDMGLSGVWFAILDGLTIASGSTRQEVEQALQRLSPRPSCRLSTHLRCTTRRTVGVRGGPAPPEAVGPRDGCAVWVWRPGYQSRIESSSQRRVEREVERCLNRCTWSMKG